MARASRAADPSGPSKFSGKPITRPQASNASMMLATRLSRSFQLRRSIAGRGFAVILSSSETATPTRLAPRSRASNRPAESGKRASDAIAISGLSNLLNPTPTRIIRDKLGGADFNLGFARGDGGLEFFATQRLACARFRATV